MASTLDPRASVRRPFLEEPPTCGPSGSERQVLLAVAADPGLSIAGLARGTGLTPPEVADALDRLLDGGYLTRHSSARREWLAVEWEAPVACGWCPGARLNDALALVRRWTDEDDAVAFSRAVERLAWGPRRDAGIPARTSQSG